MNKHRLNRILNLLLLPQNDIEIYHHDCIADTGLSYYNLKQSVAEHYAGRQVCIMEYEASKHHLEDFICKSKRINPKSLDEVFLFMDLYYPVSSMYEEIDQLYKAEKQPVYVADAISYCYLSTISKIANSLLTFRDGNIAIRLWENDKDLRYGEDIFGNYKIFDKVEVWNTLIRNTIPDIFIASFFVESDLSVEYLYCQSGMVSLADKLLSQLLKKGIAETHLHLHAGHHYSVIWDVAVNPVLWIKSSDTKKNLEKIYKKPGLIWLSTIFRLLLADFLEQRNKGRVQLFTEYIGEKFPQDAKELISILHTMHQGEVPDDREISAGIIKKIFHNLFIDEDKLLSMREVYEDFLSNTLYKKYSYYQTYSELIWLVKALGYLKEVPRDYYLAKLFIQYIRIKNDYFSTIIQSNTIQGLTFFQRYFHNAVGSLKLDRNIEYARLVKSMIKGQLSIHNLKKLEIRISPDVEISSIYDYSSKMIQQEIRKRLLIQLKEVFSAFQNYVFEILDNVAGQHFTPVNYVLDGKDARRERFTSEQIDALVQQNKINLPNIGVIYHFIKKYSMDNRIGDSCWINFACNECGWTNHKLIWRRQLTNIAICIANLRSEIPYLNEYIVGIDAASNENDAEPWLFTPVYTSIRSRLNTKPLLYEENGMIPHQIQNIGFTYHVGEDFRHILSGFRHIDEVIEHFKFIAGDRLGHAIALGADIQLWINNNEIVAMPILEYFEDLLWLWGNIVFKKMKLPISIERLEGQIMSIARKIYFDINGINTFLLYEVYQAKFLKKHDDVFEKIKSQIETCDANDKKESTNHFCRYYKDGALEMLWTKEKLICTHFCPVYEERYSRVILVDVNETSYDLLFAVQNELVNLVERSGIYVETNPTSNTAIGEIEGIFQHYIMRLNSVGSSKQNDRSSVLVTINSDDPVVFNTNVENEFAYIYHALIHNGYKKEEVLEWIDKVRQYGMESSFIKKEKKPSQIIVEINSMIKYIEDVLHSGCLSP